MRFNSFFHFLTGAWKKRQPLRRKRAEYGLTRPLVELLERRDLLAAPTIISTGVLPADGSVTASPQPLLQVTYSEKMTVSAASPANYLLVGATEGPIPIDTAVFANPGTDTMVTLTYNGGQPLVVDSYTLFVKGDLVFDADEGRAMAQPGQLVVANAGRNNLGVANLSGDGTIGALSNYNLPPTNPNPLAVSFGDLNGDVYPDLVVVNSGTQNVAIYQGKSTAEGAGFGSTPDLVLGLPTGTANLAKALVLADFNNDTNVDIAVLNNNNSNVSVFLNTRSSVGVLSLGAVTNFATGTASGPMAMVVADFDNDANLDLAVANSAVSGTNYHVSILPGDGLGGFGNPFNVVVGTTTPAGIRNPSVLAVGRINTDTKPDLVVSGIGGTAILTNQSSAGSLAFTPSTLSTDVLTSIAVGPVRPGSTTTTNPGDIVGTSPLNGGQILIYENSGNGAFFTPLPAIAAPTNPTSITLRDVDGDTKNDIVIANDAIAGNVQVLRNTGIRVAGAITGATSPPTHTGVITAASNTSPINITSAGHGLTNGDRVIVSGVGGNTAANGAFLVGNVTANSFNLVGSTGNGAYTSGGSWVVGAAITDATNATPIVITSAGHNLADGMRVSISGIGGNTAANGTFIIANSTANTFQLVGSVGNGNYTASTGTWQRTPDPVVITSNNHGLTTGIPVIVTGVGGNTGANGLFTVGAVTTNTFELIGSTGTGAYTNGGIWTIGGQVNSVTNTGPIVVSSAGHSLVTGTAVTIQGVQGTTAANGSFVITSVDADNFSLNGSQGNAAFIPNNVWAVSAPLTNATNANPIVITSVGHGLTTGTHVIVSNVQGNTAANGNFNVTVLDTNRFSLTGSNGNGVYTTNTWNVGGTITGATNASPIQITSVGHGLATGTRVRIAGVLGNTAANGSFTITVVDADNFSLNTAVGNAAYTGGGTWLVGGNITAATNAGPVQITSAAHGLVSGAKVIVAGVLGNTAANGNWTITVIDANNFTLNGSVGSGAYTTGGTWTLGGVLSNASNATPIVITSVAHGLVTGNRINISGVQGNTAANGNYVITQVSTDQFSLNGSSGNGAYVTSSWTVGGQITGATNASPIVIASANHGLNTGDRVRISGVLGNTAANGKFTITRIDNNNFSLQGSTGSGPYNSGGTWVKGSTIANASNTTPIRITSPGHNLVNGAEVTISGVLGNTAANGTFIVTVIDGDNFDLNGSVGNGQYAPGSTWNAISFAPVTGSPYGIDGNPTALALGDTNQDNVLDIITVNRTGNNFSLLLGNSNGTFRASNNIPLTPLATSDVVTGDVNGDGLQDIVTINNNSPTLTKVSVLLGRPGGTYAAPADFSPSNPGPGGADTLVSVALGDINGDGRLDIVFADRSSSRVGRLMNNIPTGAITGATNAGPIVITSPQHGLANGDHVIVSGVGGNTAANGSFVIANVTTNTFQLVGSTGNGAYATGTGSWVQGGLITGATNASPIVITSPSHGLVNGDIVFVSGVGGNTAANGTFTVANVTTNTFELAGSSGNGAYTSGGSWRLAPTLTAASFSPGSTADVGRSPTDVVLADFNKDGKLDLLVAHDGQGGGGGGSNRRGVTYKSGNGDGTFFFFPTEYVSGSQIVAIDVGDFNADGNLDFVAVENPGGGGGGSFQVHLRLGNGNGTFSSSVGPFATGVTNPGAIAVADFNGDGFQDLIVSSKSTSNSNVGTGVAVLLNQLGSGFSTTPLTFPVLPGTGLQSVLVSDLNQDGKMDAIVSTISGGSTLNNVFALIGNGQGSFVNVLPYLVGGVGTPALATSYLAQTPFPLIRATTFTSGGGRVNADLVRNGDFEARDLSGEKGNLLGWEIYRLPGSPDGSQGAWTIQTGTESPFSGTTVSKPVGQFRALLDQYNLIPYTGNNNPNADSTYSGTHALYQNIDLPSGIAKLSLTLSLLIDNSASASGYSDASSNSLLDYRTTLDNQQVRVDVMDPASPGSILGVTRATGVLRNIFQTTPTTANSLSSSIVAVLASTISDATNPVSGPIVITSNGHTLATGDKVTISGVKGNTAANGVWTITVIDNNKFSLDNSTGNGAYTTGGNWTVLPTGAITGATNPASGPIVITSIGHGLVTGDKVSIADVQGNTAANGTWTVTVIDNDTFSLNTSAGNAAYVSGGSWSLATVRLRIAATNNRGQLIVGVDGVKFVAQFTDQSGPTLSDLGVRNPAFFGAPNGNTPHTNDPTIVGRIGDNSNLNSISYIEFDTRNNGFGDPDDVKTTQWDAVGNFSFSLQNVPAGLNTIGVRVVDKALNVTTSTITLYMQSNSNLEWEGIGPQGIDVSGQGVDYTRVSGRITATVPDVTDKSGSTYYIGSANGGVWKTTNGGASWTALTDRLTDSSGNPINVPIGGLAQSLSNPSVLYAGTGVGDLALDSRAGLGVLKSVDGGKTWTVAGDSATVLGGARVVKVVIGPNVDPNEEERVYVAVAANGANTTGAIFRSEDGGQTWVNVLDPAKMNLAAGGTVGAGTNLASVTDLIIDPNNSRRLMAGLGNIGLLPARNTAGLWISINSGDSWTQIRGGDSAAPPAPALPVPNSTLPTGVGIGRVTMAMGSGRTGDEPLVYVLMGTPPGNNTPPNVDFGKFSALYKSKDNLLNFTKVTLRQDVGVPGDKNFVDINLFGNDAANVGAMVVDPANPNVVIIGGSRRWSKPGDPPAHSLIRVDTGNMRDTTYVVNNTIPNDGDDARKAARAFTNGGFYDPATLLDPYPTNGGEGVYWYDLEQDESGSNGNSRLVPEAITSLIYDAQGRLLIGTVGGLWRGVNHGFGYDFTSGDDGILAGGFGNRFSAPSMDFTAISGNLQISDMTSVAIDGTQRGSYFSTQIDTGVAASNSSLSWVSQGLTGPTVAGNNLGIPSAGAVLASEPAPGSPDGTPGTLFRIWQYANGLALRPETSSDNGATWGSIDSAGIHITGNFASNFPAFAINPTPIAAFDSSGNIVYHTELLFGSNRVYLTRTSGAVWDAISPVLSPAGGLITAMSFAPSASGVYYVGTNRGELYYTANGGADNWPQRNAGLPAAKINGLAVDPNNPNIAYVMFGGTGLSAYVFKTTNAGLTWTSISSTLPNVPAYSMVIDKRAGLGAPNGKIYVATDVGVFYSINGGTNWIRLGQGMPNVPVVDLKHNANLDVLAAATLGRGAFTINTGVIAPIADQVTNKDVPIGPLAFTINDPGGVTYTLTAVSDNQALVPTENIVLSGSGANRTIQLTPALHATTALNGVANITITLTSGSIVDTQTFQVTVNSTDYAPTILVPGPQITPKDQSLTVNFTVSDIETVASALIVNAGSSNNALVPNLPANLVLGGTGTNRTLTIIPAPGQVGSTVITLTVTDSSGAVASKQFDVLVTQSAALPFTDNFNRTNSVFLGIGWNLNSGKLGVNNSQAKAGAGLSIASLNQVSAADISLQADVNVAISQDMGFIARYSGTGTNNFYIGRVVSVAGGFQAEIAKNVNGVVTVLSKKLVDSGVGTLRFEVVGNSLKLFFDKDGAGVLNVPELVAYVNDATFTGAGTAGLYSQLGNASADNFSASAIALLTPPLPFNDAFSVAVDKQLSRNWLEQAGNFKVDGGILVAMDAGTKLNLATVNGIQSNSSVQAFVTVIPGQQAGVVARYSAAGMYYARILNDGVKTTAAIYKVSAAGTQTLLGSIATLPLNPTTGTVRLEIAGPSLKLFFNPTPGSAPVAFAYDQSFASGLNGVRASKDATLDSFTTDAINLLTPTLPFSETFTQPDGPLSLEWNDKAGNFRVTSSVLRGTAPTINMATINGVLSDGIIQADVVLGNAVGQQVGVVARHSSSITTPILNTYYYAQIVKTATGAQARIFKVTENTVTKAISMTQLGATAPVATGPGTIKLEVAGPSLKFFYGANVGAMTLATSAYDSAFTSGTFGVRATTDTSAPANATQINKVDLSAIVLTTPTYPFTETFTQTDGTALSYDWTERQGSFSVSTTGPVDLTGALVANYAGTSLATVNGLLADSSIQADILVGANQQAGLVTRFKASNGQYYYAQLANVTTTNATTQVTTSKTTLTLYKFTGSLVQLAAPVTVSTATATAPATITYDPATLRFEVAGNNLKAFYDLVGGTPTLRTYAYDSALPAAGFNGIRSTKNATFDNVIVDQITLLTPPLAFTDSFSQTVGSQLSRNWDERAGNFSVAATPSPTSPELKANSATINQATVHGVSLADVSVQADVTVGVGQHGGVIARYTPAAGTAQDKFYFARILSVTGGFKAEIQEKASNGTVTTIASVPVASGVGTIKFEVAGSNLKLFYGPIGGPLALVAYGFDASPLTAGFSGIRATKDVVLDNFNINAITLTSPPLPFTETFTLTPNNQLSTNWLERAGNFSVVGDVLTGQNASINLATVNGPIGDGAMQADVAVSAVAGQQAGLVARFTTSGYYYARVVYTGAVYQAAIYKVVGSTFTALTTPVTVASGTGTLRFEVAGPSLKLSYIPLVGATTRVNGYDTAFTTGTSGVRLTKSAPTPTTIDTFTLSAITLTTRTAPFTDTFSRPSDGSPLPDGWPSSYDWTERSGLFQITNNALSFVNASTINFATLNGVSLADVAVQADVVIGGVKGKQAALIARYSAAGYYLAIIQNANGANQYVAQLYRVVNNVLTRLDSPASPAFLYGTGTTAGTMRLEVAGSSLKLFFGPVGGSLTLRAFGNDTKLLSAGTVGVRTIGSTVDNFNVSGITLQNPSVPFSDPFTQAAGSELSLKWLNRAGNYTAFTDAAGNQLIGNATSNLATANTANLPNAVVEVKVSLGLGQAAGAVARYSIAANGTPSYYLGRVASVDKTVSPSGFRAEIWKFVGGTGTLLSSAPVTSGVLNGILTGLVRFQVVANNLKLFYGASVAVLNFTNYAYDSSLTTGVTGIASTKNVVLDNFATDAVIIPTSQPIPFTETFATTPPTIQLSTNWLERAGSFRFDPRFNRLAGQAATNIATVNGINVLDSDLQGVFNLTNVGQSAGLISRYASNTNMYFASVTYTATNSYTVKITKVVNGTATVISQAVIASFSGNIRFSTIGNSLKVYVDGSAVPLLSVTDAALRAPGLVGIQSSLGAQLTSFAAN